MKEKRDFLGDYELEDASDGTKILLKYKGDGGEVIIPDELNITIIGRDAFKESDVFKIKSNTVERIGNYAFENCENLKSVDFPNTEIIGENAFTHCSNLESVNFPKVKVIEYRAFYNCGKLREFLGNPNITSIGSNAFVESQPGGEFHPVPIYLDTVKYLNFGEVMFGGEAEGRWYEYYKIEEVICDSGCYWLRDHKFEDKELVKHDCDCAEVIIPDELNITIIGRNAFTESDVFKIKSNTVERIGNYAFENCENLKSVDFPNTETIGQNAFTHCSNLESVNFPKVKVIEDRAFYNCEKLIEFLGNPNITYIGVNAFAESQPGWESFPLPIPLDTEKYLKFEGVWYGGEAEGTWYEYYKIEEIIRDSGCYRLRDHKFEGKMLLKHDCDCAEVIIPDELNITIIGYNAFKESNAFKIKSNTVEKIERIAFKDCENLTSVDFPKVITIEAGAFYNCDNLKKLNFPIAQLIESSSFISCTSLESADFPLVFKVEQYAFSDCNNLKKVNFPYIKRIEQGTFFNCKKLSIFSGSPYIEYIGDDAFVNCYRLKSVNFPNVKTIKDKAFNNCRNLKSVNFPKAKTIEKCAFQSCENLKSVDFPNAKTIGEWAFSECRNLKSVDFPNAKTIGKYTFLGCDSLKDSN